MLFLRVKSIGGVSLIFFSLLLPLEGTPCGILTNKISVDWTGGGVAYNGILFFLLRSPLVSRPGLSRVECTHDGIRSTIRRVRTRTLTKNCSLGLPQKRDLTCAGSTLDDAHGWLYGGQRGYYVVQTNFFQCKDEQIVD